MMARSLHPVAPMDTASFAALCADIAANELADVVTYRDGMVLCGQAIVCDYRRVRSVPLRNANAASCAAHVNDEWRECPCPTCAKVRSCVAR